MERIYDTTAAASLPAVPTLAGTVGYFTEGTPGVTPATDVRGWWLNMIQEELMSLLTAASITPDTTGAVFTQVLQALFTLPGKNVQTFGASGSFTVPANVTKLDVTLVGAGGGGGYGGSANFGSGGGSSGVGRKICTVTPGAVITVTLGAAGAAGISGTAATAGGTSSFGSFLSITGGGAGVSNSATPGGPGVATGGDLDLPGGYGFGGYQASTGSYLGGAGNGAPGYSVPTNYADNGAGNSATGPGSGGGAGSNGNAGAAGAVGVCIVRW